MDFAEWCLAPYQKGKVVYPCADIVVCVLELIETNTINSLRTELGEFTEENQAAYQNRSLNDPQIVAEIQRINTDIELARDYPQNIERIIQQKAKYHILDLDLSLL